MPTPWAILSERIAARFGEGPAPAIREGLQATVAPDAIVIRPDEPWIEPKGQGASWARHLERWAAVMAVSATTPDQAVGRLYAYARAVMDAASDEGWDWVSVTSISLDESTGTPLLVAVVRLTYKAPKQEEV